MVLEYIYNIYIYIYIYIYIDFFVELHMLWHYLTYMGVGGYKRIHIFFKDINSKVNLIAWLVFKLAYEDGTVQHANLYATATIIID